jgi:hypothetical protein
LYAWFRAGPVDCGAGSLVGAVTQPFQPAGLDVLVRWPLLQQLARYQNASNPKTKITLKAMEHRKGRSESGHILFN